MSKYRFRLFVAGSSPNSQTAKANLQAFCATLPEDSWQAEVVDILRVPKVALAESIYVTPTLHLEYLDLPRRVVGTLGDADLLRALLDLPPG